MGYKKPGSESGEEALQEARGLGVANKFEQLKGAVDKGSEAVFDAAQELYTLAKSEKGQPLAAELNKLAGDLEELAGFLSPSES